MNTSISFLFIPLLLNLSLSSQDLSHSKESTRPGGFKENKGQVSDQFYKARPDILFSGNEGDLVFHLKSNGISYQLNRVDEWTVKEERPWRKTNVEWPVPAKSTVYRVDVNWLNTNQFPEIKKGAALQGYENYYLECCPAGALEVKSYSEITYRNLYPGIDLKWYEKNGGLEYDYLVAANADYKAIQLEYQGAETIYVNADGELIIKTPLGTIKEQKPLVIQNNKVLSAGWTVKNNIISFDIKNADPALPLVIDPAVRLWATYYGGTAQDDTYYTYCNSIGEVFLSGSTGSSANIATTGAHQTTFAGGVGNGDGYLVKFDPAGARLWATYYGGLGHDYACESIEDANGNVFLTGGTQSASPGVIATAGAHQTVYSAASTNSGDAFLVMFNSSGVRQWGTYYGGDNNDFGNGIALDNSGNIFISGASQSTNNIATPGSHQPALANGQDCFFVKFNSAGVRQWGTYFGGNSLNEVSTDCLTNASGDLYITGATSSSVGISTPGSHQSVYGGGPNNGAGDAYLAKFNSAGICQWSTYYGGTGSEVVNKIAIETSGDIYCGGWTSSATGTAIATPGSHQTVFGGAHDAFLAKFNPAGVRQWGTFYGGNGNDYGCVSVDALGNVYLSGDAATNNGTSIATPCAYQPIYAGGSSDAFLAKFRSTGERIWGTYYGSIYSEYSYSSYADGLGNVYLSGFTFANSGTVIASANGHQPVGGGGTDAFLVKFDGCFAGNAIDMTPPSKLVVCAGNSTTLTATCGNWYSSPTGTTSLATGGTFTTGAITSDTTFYVEDTGCGSVTGTRTAISVTLAPSQALTLTNSNPTACVGESITLTASGASTYTWVNNSATTSTIQLVVFLYTSYTVNSIDTYGCKATETLAVVPNLCEGIQENGMVNSGIIVYPNPNNGSFNLQSTAPITLRLTNELGQTVRDISLTPFNNYTVTVDKLANGVYFLNGKKDDKIFNKKIIVIH